MDGRDEFRFIARLRKDLGSGDISLPSLPDVVVRLRALLEHEACDFDQVSQAVRTDPALVSRLMLFANSAYHNPGGEPVHSLDVAIARLGFEAIRNAALSLAVKQLLLGEEHKEIVPHLKQVWSRSIQLAAMSFAVAGRRSELNHETAFMCGLLNQIGKLYILIKCREFPVFLQDAGLLRNLLDTWYPRIGKSILEDWGFEEEIYLSADPQENVSERPDDPPNMVDAVYVSGLLLDKAADKSIDFSRVMSCEKLDVTDDSFPEILSLYQQKLQSVRQSLSSAAKA
jgi:HD-like signal output (HDOD) protein